MNDCFLCRVMRSFGLTGLGALVGGYGALLLGLPREQAVWFALGGGLVCFFLMTAAKRRGRRGRRE